MSDYVLDVDINFSDLDNMAKKYLKEKAKIEGDVIKVRINADEKDFTNIENMIKGLSKEDLSKITLSVDSGSIVKQLESLSGYVGKNGKVVGEAFRKNVQQGFESLSFDDLLSKSIGSDKRKWTKNAKLEVINNLKKVMDQGISPEKGYMGILKQAEAYEQLLNVVRELNTTEHKDHGLLELSELSFDELNKDIKSKYTQIGKIFSTGEFTSQFQTELQNAFDLIENNIENFANSLMITFKKIGTGLSGNGTGSGGSAGGVGNEINQEIDQLTQQIEQATKKLDEARIKLEQLKKQAKKDGGQFDLNKMIKDYEDNSFSWDSQKTREKELEMFLIMRQKKLDKKTLTKSQNEYYNEWEKQFKGLDLDKIAVPQVGDNTEFKKAIQEQEDLIKSIEQDIQTLQNKKKQLMDELNSSSGGDGTGKGGETAKVGAEPDGTDFVKKLQEQIDASGEKVKVLVDPDVEDFITNAQEKIDGQNVNVDIKPNTENFKTDIETAIDAVDVKVNLINNQQRSSIHDNLLAWNDRNKKDVFMPKPEQAMIMNDQSGYSADIQNDVVAGVSTQIINQAIKEAEERVNSVMHSHPNEQTAAFSFDDLLAAIQQKTNGIIHQYITSINDVAMFDVSDFSPVELKQISDAIKSKMVDIGGNFAWDEEDVFSNVIQPNISEYINSIILTLQNSMLSNGADINDVQKIVDDFQTNMSKVNMKIIDNYDDFYDILFSNIEQSTSNTNINGNDIDNYISTIMSHAQQKFAESVMLSAIKQIRPDINISDIYKKTSLQDYFAGESLLPGGKIENISGEFDAKVKVDTSTIRSDIESELQSEPFYIQVDHSDELRELIDTDLTANPFEINVQPSNSLVDAIHDMLDNNQFDINIGVGNASNTRAGTNNSDNPYQIIYDMMQADKIMQEKLDGDDPNLGPLKERAMFFNSKNGKHTNPYYFDKHGSNNVYAIIPKDENGQYKSGVYDTGMHSHPEKFAQMSIGETGDLISFFYQMMDAGISKQIIAGRNDVQIFDSKSFYDDLGELIVQQFGTDFVTDSFLQKIGEEVSVSSRFYNTDFMDNTQRVVDFINYVRQFEDYDFDTNSMIENIDDNPSRLKNADIVDVQLGRLFYDGNFTNDFLDFVNSGSVDKSDTLEKNMGLFLERQVSSMMDGIKIDDRVIKQRIRTALESFKGSFYHNNFVGTGNVDGADDRYWDLILRYADAKAWENLSMVDPDTGEIKSLSMDWSKYNTYMPIEEFRQKFGNAITGNGGLDLSQLSGTPLSADINFDNASQKLQEAITSGEPYYITDIEVDPSVNLQQQIQDQINGGVNDGEQWELAEPSNAKAFFQKFGALPTTLFDNGEDYNYVLQELGGEFSKINTEAEGFSEQKLNIDFLADLIPELDLAEEKLLAIKELLHNSYANYNLREMLPAGEADSIMEKNANRIMEIIDGANPTLQEIENAKNMLKLSPNVYDEFDNVSQNKPYTIQVDIDPTSNLSSQIQDIIHQGDPYYIKPELDPSSTLAQDIQNAINNIKLGEQKQTETTHEQTHEVTRPMADGGQVHTVNRQSTTTGNQSPILSGFDTLSVEEKAQKITGAIKELESQTGQSLASIITNWESLDEQTRKVATGILSSVNLIKDDGSFNFDIASTGRNTNGRNGIAILTSDFAVLQKGITQSDEELEMFITKIKEVRQQGVNVSDVFANFRSGINKDTGYQIQERINGEVLGTPVRARDENSETAQNRIVELGKVLQSSDQELLKFIQDWIVLNKTLQTDANNPSNFIKNKNGYTAIDLGLTSNPRNLSNKDAVNEIMTAAVNGAGLYKAIDINPEVRNIAAQVAQKIANVAIEAGLISQEEAMEVISRKQGNLGELVKLSPNKTPVSTPDTTPDTERQTQAEHEQEEQAHRTAEAEDERRAATERANDASTTPPPSSDSGTQQNADSTTVAISAEEAALDRLKQKLVSEIPEAVDVKTQAFRSEQVEVENLIDLEISKLEELGQALQNVFKNTEGSENIGSLKDLLDALNSFGGEGGVPNLDGLSKTIDELVQALSRLNGITPDTNLTDMLNGLKFSEKNVSALENVAVGIELLAETLNKLKGIEGVDSTFSQIDDLLKNAEALKDLAKVLSATSKERERASREAGISPDENAEKANAEAEKYIDNLTKYYSLQDELNKRRVSGNEKERSIKDIAAEEKLLRQINEYEEKINKKRMEGAEITEKEQAAINKRAELEEEVNTRNEKYIQEKEKAEEINRKQQIKSIKDSIPALEQTIQGLKDGNEFIGVGFSEEIDKLEMKFRELKSIDLVDEGDVSRAKEIEKEIMKMISDIRKNPDYEKAKDTSRTNLQKKAGEWLQKNTAAPDALRQQVTMLYNELQSDVPVSRLREIAAELNRVGAEAAKAGQTGKSFGDKLKGSFGHLARYLASFASFYRIIGVLKQAFNIVKELDTSLTEMRKVSDESVETLKNYQVETFNMADKVGTTAKQIQDSTADWMRLGETLTEASKSAQDSTILLNVSEFSSIDEATQSLVSMSQAYQELDKIDIIDKLNNIGNNFSISTDQLATGLQNAAAVLKTQGNDLDQAIALITAGNAITQNVSKTSAGVRTIALRISGTEEAKDEIQDMGEDVDDFVVRTKSKTDQIIRDYTAVASNAYQGVSVLDPNGNLRDTYDILLDIAEIYEEIQKEDKQKGTNRAQALVETLAGKNRSNIAASILNNPQMLKDVYESSQQSHGSAQEELNKYLDSVQGKLAKLQNRLQELAAVSIDSEWLKTIIDLGSGAIKIITDLGKQFGTINMLLGGIAGFLLQKSGKGLFNFDKSGGKTFGLKTIIDSFKSVKKEVPALSKELETLFKKNADQSLSQVLQSGQIYNLKDNKFSNFINTYTQNMTDAQKEGLSFAQVANAYNESLIANGETITQVSSKLVTFKNILSGVGTAFLSTIAINVAFAAIGGIIKLIDDAIHRSEKLIATGKQAQKDIEETRTSIVEAEDFQKDSAKDFTKLREGVSPSTNKNISLTNEQYEQYIELSNKVAEIYPSVVSSYDAQGNAILNLSSDANEANNQLQELLATQEQIAGLKISKKLDDVFAGAYEESTTLNAKITELENRIKDEEEAQGFFLSGNKISKFVDDVLNGRRDNEIKLSSEEAKAVGDALEEAGLAYQLTDNLDGKSSLSLQLQFYNEEEIKKMAEDFAGNIANYGFSSNIGQQISEDYVELSGLKQELDAVWNGVAKDVIDSFKQNPVYNQMSEELKTGLNSVISDIDYSSLEKPADKTWEEYLKSTYLYPITAILGEAEKLGQSATPELKNAKEAINGLLTMDTSKQSAKKYEDQLNNYLDALQKYWVTSNDEDERKGQLEYYQEFLIHMGYRVENPDGTISDISQTDHILANLRDQFGPLSEEMEKQLTEDLSLDQLIQVQDIATSSGFAGSLQDAIKRVIEGIKVEPEKDSTLSSIFNDGDYQKDAEGYEKSLSSLTSALETIRTEGKLTAEQMRDLQEEMPDLTDFSEESISKNAFQELDKWIDKIRENWKDMSPEGLEQMNTYIQNLIDSYGDLNVTQQQVKDQFITADPNTRTSDYIEQSKQFEQNMSKIRKAYGDDINWQVVYELIASDQFSGTAEEIKEKYDNTEFNWEINVKLAESKQKLDKEIEDLQNDIAHEEAKNAKKEAGGGILNRSDFSGIVDSTQSKADKKRAYVKELADEYYSYRPNGAYEAQQREKLYGDMIKADTDALEAEADALESAKNQDEQILNEVNERIEKAQADQAEAQHEIDQAIANDQIADKSVYERLATAQENEANAQNTLAEKYDWLYGKYGDNTYFKSAADARSAALEAQTSSVESRNGRITAELDALQNGKGLGAFQSYTDLQRKAAEYQEEINQAQVDHKKVNENTYKKLISNGDKQIKNLNEQKKRLQQLQSTAKDTSAWRTYQSQIEDIDDAIMTMGRDQTGWFEEMNSIISSNAATLSSTISNAFAEINSETGLTTETMMDLQTAFSDLAGSDVSNIFYQSADGMKFNIRAAESLIDAEYELQTNNLYDTIEQQKEIIEQQGDAQTENAQKTVAAAEQRIAAAQRELSMLQAQYDQQKQAFSDFAQWQNAGSTANKGDRYTTIQGALKDVQEAYSKGLTGTDEFKTFTSMIDEWGVDTAAAYSRSIEKIKKYFTEDNTGLTNFYKDAVEKGWGTYSEELGYSLAIPDVEQFAHEMDLSQEMVNILLSRAEDYGVFNDWVSTRADGELKLKENMETLTEAQFKYNQMVADGAPQDALENQLNYVKELEEHQSNIIENTADVTAREGVVTQKDLRLGFDQYTTLRTDKERGLIDEDTYRQKVQQLSDQFGLILTPDLKIDMQEMNKQYEGWLTVTPKIDWSGIENEQGSEAYNSAVEKVRGEWDQNSDALQGYISTLSEFSEEDLKKMEEITLSDGKYNVEGNLIKAEDALQGMADMFGLNKEEAQELLTILKQIGAFNGTSNREYSTKQAQAVGLVSDYSTNNPETILGGVRESVSNFVHDALTKAEEQKKYEERSEELQPMIDATTDTKTAIDAAGNEIVSAIQNLPNAIANAINGSGEEPEYKMPNHIQTAIENGASIGEAHLAPTQLDTTGIDTSPIQIPVNYEPDTKEADSTKQEMESNPIKQEVQLDYQPNDKQNLPKGTTVTNTVTADTSGAENAINSVNSEMSSVATTHNTTFTGDSSDLVSEAEAGKQAADEVPEEKTTHFKAFDAVTGVANGIKNVVSTITGKNIEISASVSGIDALVRMKEAIDNIKSKVVNIISNVFSKKGSDATGTAHVSHATGTAYSMWSDYRHSIGAYANGTKEDWRLPSDEDALVNEVGTESIVRDGKWFEIPGGAHVEQLKRGDIIFSAKQTEELKKYGKVYSGGGHGRVAYANGTAYNMINAYSRNSKSASTDSGNFKPGGGGTTHSGGNGGSASDSTVKAVTGAVNNNTNATKGSTDATKANTSALDKFKNIFENVKDWVEVRLDRLGSRIDLLTAKAENLAGYSLKNAEINQAMKKVEERRDFAKEAVNTYKNYSNTVKEKAVSEGLVTKDEAEKIYEKVLNGANLIEQYKGTKSGQSNLALMGSVAKKEKTNVEKKMKKAKGLTDEQKAQIQSAIDSGETISDETLKGIKKNKSLKKQINKYNKKVKNAPDKKVASWLEKNKAKIGDDAYNKISSALSNGEKITTDMIDSITDKKLKKKFKNNQMKKYNKLIKDNTASTSSGSSSSGSKKSGSGGSSDSEQSPQMTYIEELEKWIEKMIGAEQTVEECNSQLKELAQTKLDNITDQFDSIVEKGEAANSVWQADIDMVSTANLGNHEIGKRTVMTNQMKQQRSITSTKNQEKVAYKAGLEDVVNTFGYDSNEFRKAQATYTGLIQAWVESMTQELEYYKNYLGTYTEAAEARIEDINTKTANIDAYSTVGSTGSSGMAKAIAYMTDKVPGLNARDESYKNQNKLLDYQLKRSKDIMGIRRKEASQLKGELASAQKEWEVAQKSNLTLEEKNFFLQKRNIAMDAYNKSVQSMTQAESDYAAMIVKNEQEKFSNIEKYYDTKLNYMKSEHSLHEKEIELDNYAKGIMSDAEYGRQIKNNADETAVLVEELTALQKKLASGAIAKNTDEWKELQVRVNNVKGSIQDLRQENLDLFKDWINNPIEKASEKLSNVDFKYLHRTEAQSVADSGMAGQRAAMRYITGNTGLSSKRNTYQNQNALLDANLAKAREEMQIQREAEAQARKNYADEKKRLQDMKKQKVAAKDIRDQNQRIALAYEAVKNAATSAAQAEANYASTYVANEQKKFENIQKYYQNLINYQKSVNENREKEIELANKSLGYMTNGEYTTGINDNAKETAYLNKELTDLQKQLNSGKIGKGTDEWRDLQSQLNEVTGSLNSVREENLSLYETFAHSPIDKAAKTIDKLSNALNRLKGVYSTVQSGRSGKSAYSALLNTAATSRTNASKQLSTARSYKKTADNGVKSTSNALKKAVSSKSKQVPTAVRTAINNAIARGQKISLSSKVLKSLPSTVQAQIKAYNKSIDTRTKAANAVTSASTKSKEANAVYNALNTGSYASIAKKYAKDPTYKLQNALLDQELSQQKQIMNTYQTAVKQTTDNVTTAATNKSTAQKTLTNQANNIIKKYGKKLSSTIVNKLKKGQKLTNADMSTVKDKTILSSLNSYNSAFDKAKDSVTNYNVAVAAQTEAIQNYAEAAEEYAQQIVANEIEKFNNVSSYWQTELEYRRALNEEAQKSIDLSHAHGNYATQGEYQKQIDRLKSERTIMQNERKALQAQLDSSVKSGKIKKNSEEWKQLQTQIENLDASILDVGVNIENLTQSMLEVKYAELFERAAKAADLFIDRLETINGLISDEMLFDKEGQLTAFGALSLQENAKALDKNISNLKLYMKERQQIIDDYNKGLFGKEKFDQMMEQNQSSINNYLNAANQSRQAILKIVKDQAQEELNAISKTIDARKDALSRKKE